MRWIVLAGFVAACDSDRGDRSGTTEAPEPAAPSTTLPASTAPATAAQASTAPAASPAPDPDEVRAFRNALLLGRRLSRARQHTEAIAAFRVALEAMPGHPLALGELGFAALGAGDLALAEQSSRDAAHASLDPRHRAASLFNLGSALERLGRREDAARAYAESIALRPNRTVEAALDALGTPVPVPPTPAPTVSASSLADACAALERGHRESGGVGEPRCDPATARVVSGSGAVVSAALLSVVAVDPQTNGEDGLLHLALQTSSGWALVDRVGEWIAPGALGMAGACEVKELSVRDLAPGGEPEVVADVECLQRDEDFGICEVATMTDRSVTVAGLVDGNARVVRRIPVAHFFEQSALPGCDVEPALRSSGLPSSQGWRGSIALEPGHYSFSLLAGTAPPDVVELMGTKSIEAR